MALYFEQSDFVGEIKLDFGTYTDFNVWGDQLQYEYLVTLMGYSMYNDMLTNPQESKYIDLIDGLTIGYEIDGVTYPLQGIGKMMPYFFYTRYQQNLQTNQTTIGEFQALSENDNRLDNKNSLNVKVIRSYNKGLIMYNELIAYIEYKNTENGADYYPNFAPTYLEDENNYGIY